MQGPNRVRVLQFAETFLAPRYIQKKQAEDPLFWSDITLPTRRALYDITSNGLIVI
jgi:hypothetical protein